HYWRWLLPLYSTVLALQIPLQPYPQLPLLLLLAAIPIFSPPLPQLLLCLILPMGITLLLQPQYWPLLFLGLFLSLLLWRQGRLWQRAHLLAYRQQQRLQRQLARRSSQDPLTGLANGRHFAQRLLQQVSESKRSKSPLSLCLLDVDYFTAYNQYYGSAQGDHCLCTLAVRLSQCSQRQSDLVARLSGDTFALLLPATDRKGAEKLLQRFHEQLAQKPIAHAGSPIHSDVTLTTAIEQWQLGNDHQLFFNRAKHTLQQAKLAEMPLDYAP
ncbi:MAG: diguanylate cyclase, partial [Ferrimonas sp.]